MIIITLIRNQISTGPHWRRAARRASGSLSAGAQRPLIDFLLQEARLAVRNLCASLGPGRKWLAGEGALLTGLD